MNQFRTQILAAAVLVAGSLASAEAATIVITSRDAAGMGFNDPTPVAPIGGNLGVTLGQQRWNVYRFVADVWEKQLDSAVPITVSAGWEALACTTTTATLGSAGALGYWRNFDNAPLRNTWYPRALANKLAGKTLTDGQIDTTGYSNMDIKTQFNVNLGQPTCLPSKPFYLGLDGKAPANSTDLMGVLLHELGHGLGFAAGTNGQTGARISSGGTGYPSVWEAQMLDNVTGKRWLDMNNTERMVSAVNGRRLVWTGANVLAGLPQVLQLGTPLAKITAPSTIARSLDVGLATFGAVLSEQGLSGEVMPVVDQPDGTSGQACSALSAANAAAVRNKIALVDRGTCSFVIKAKMVQDAGAVAVLVVDNVADTPPPGMSGTDPSVTIPAVRITRADGDSLKAALKTRSRTRSGLYLTLGLDKSQYAGADAKARPYLYTPNPYASGSSVSHWDTSASPDLLMEPFSTPGLSTVLVPPKDLTFPLLKDLGW